VTAVHADGKCDIAYDDGDSEERVAPRFVKLLLSDEEKRAAAAVLPSGEAQVPQRTEKDEARGGGFALRDVCGIQGCPLPNNHPGLCQVLVTCSRRGKAVQPVQPAQPGASATAGSSKPASAPPAKRQRKSMPVDPAAASLLASVSPRALSIGSGLRRVATAAFGRALNKAATGR